MALRLVIEPVVPILTLAEAKSHLAIDSDTSWDGLVTGLVAAAQQHLDGRDGVLGRCIGVQTWEAVEDSIPLSGAMRLPLPPLVSVLSVRYYDTAGALQTFSPANYTVDTTNQPGWIALNDDAAWPETANMVNAVIVRFEAGYTTVPQPIKQAAALLVGHWFANREAVVIGSAAAGMVPMAVDALIEPYRIRAFG